MQVLACGACELLDELTRHKGLENFTGHIQATFSDTHVKEIKKLRNKYWNAFKHYFGTDHRTPRKDDELIRSFRDNVNDHHLFIGWSDYANLTGALPIHAQIFQVWYYALNKEKLAPESNTAGIENLFPNLVAADRTEQKRRLMGAIKRYKNDRTLLADNKTEASLSLWH